ncbi:MAG: prolipoprotein diacylglyceryl transferase [Nitrospirae bacterium]|nr:prolipoprotein diacylglyceryl transferase [Nitrospirota bacterium]
MYPTLIKIGPIAIHTYGVMIALAFIVGIALAIRLGKKENITKEQILDIGFYTLLAAIIGSRLFYVLVEYKYFIKNPIDIFKVWEGGLVFYGGLLFVLPVVFYYFKRNKLPLWNTFDLFSPSVAIGHAIGRIGCLCAGCCYGMPTNLPWGITFKNPEALAIKGVPLHPTQLYESAAELSIFIFLMFFRKRKTFDGQIFWIYILLYSVTRFIIEFFRGDEIRGFIYDGISFSQGISIALFLTAMIFLVFLRKKSA